MSPSQFISIFSIYSGMAWECYFIGANVVPGGTDDILIVFIFFYLVLVYNFPSYHFNAQQSNDNMQVVSCSLCSDCSEHILLCPPLPLCGGVARDTDENFCYSFRPCFPTKMNLISSKMASSSALNAFSTVNDAFKMLCIMSQHIYPRSVYLCKQRFRIVQLLILCSFCFIQICW